MAILLKKMTIFVNFFEKMSNSWQFLTVKWQFSGWSGLNVLCYFRQIYDVLIAVFVEMYLTIQLLPDYVCCISMFFEIAQFVTASRFCSLNTKARFFMERRE